MCIPAMYIMDPKGEFGKPNSTQKVEEDNIQSPTLKSSRQSKKIKGL